jgi:glutamate-1-semialdehyde 2,1-aminomutase
MNTVAIIQARMGSTRLPGKVMMPLGGHPVLEWCVRAARAAVGVDQVYVATSTLPADDVIANWCDDHGVLCWRGSETDVLDRFIGCARTAGADVILRLTGDEPFLDPRLIAEVVALQARSGADYVSSCHPRTYPDGLDVECVTRNALEAAHREARRPIDRDTVTYWIMRNRSRFPAEALINPVGNLAHERWVLDTEPDYAFCQAIAHYWPWDNGPPSLLAILGILDRNPRLRDLNAGQIMNERFYEALAQEAIVPRSYPRSQAQFARAEKVIPFAAQTFSKSYLQFPQPSPLFLSHGQGSLVWDIDGNEYVDLVSALLPNILGYCDADVDSAIRRQIASGISSSLATELEAQLAETLCRLIPCAEMVKFGKTGTDVTTAAVRLARAYTGREQVLICGGYHGWADWSVERNKGVPPYAQWMTHRVPFGDQSAALSTLSYAAVIVEPESNPDYLRWLRGFCDRTGAVLIFDEVITGFRFDLGGAQKLWGVYPDLACFGKAMANGMPLSALVGRRDIMRRMAPPDNIFYSGTFFGETLSLAAGIATIAKLERERVIPHLWDLGHRLGHIALKTINRHGLETTIMPHGQPPLVRLNFSSDAVAALFRREMIASGTLIIASHNVCAALGASEIARVAKSYDHACGVVAEAIRTGDIERRLAGSGIAKGVRA